MPDEAATTTSAGSAATPGAVAQGASSSSANTDGLFIDETGAFQDGWKNKYIPEDLRDDKVYDGTPNVSEMAKMLGNLQRVIGKKGIIPPGENASPSEMEAFHKALGKPDSYKFEIPKDYESYYDKPTVDEAMSRLGKVGLTQKQFDEVMAIQRDIISRGDAAMKADPLASYEQIMELAAPVLKANAEKEMRTKFGEAFDEKVHLANKLIADNEPDEIERNKILATVGNDARVANFLANIQSKFEEHKLVTGGEPQKGVMTPGQARLRMDELAATPDFASGKLNYSNPAAAKRIQDEMAALAAMIQKSKVG